MTDWCSSGTHNDCVREWQRFYIDPKTNKPIMLDEWLVCECSKRGCPCYVPAKERGKKRTARRKK